MERNPESARAQGIRDRAPRRTIRREVVVRALAGLLCLSLLGANSPAAAQSADSTKSATLFDQNDLIYAGAFTLGTVALFPLDRFLANEIQGSRFQENHIFRVGANVDYIGRPGAFIIGALVYAGGRLAGSERFADLGLHGTEALLASELVTRLIKPLAGRSRPYLDQDNPTDFKLGRGFRDQTHQSFPSGHTSVAFAAAAAVTTEMGTWWPDAKPYIGTAMYGGAALVGISRMYRNKHWASDVASAAAIGTFVSWKVIRYNHNNPGNRVDRWLLGVHVEPSAAGHTASLFLAPVPGL
jgi:membrane-associated phospholipid phosphatase